MSDWLSTICWRAIVLISQGYHEKLPQTWWFKQQHYLLSYIWRSEAWNKCWQAHAPSKGSRGVSFLPLPGSGGCWQCLAFLGLYAHPISVCLHLLSPCVSLLLPSPFMLLIRTLIIGFKAHRNPKQSHLEILTLIKSARLLFQTGSHSEVVAQKKYLFQATIPPSITIFPSIKLLLHICQRSVGHSWTDLFWVLYCIPLIYMSVLHQWHSTLMTVAM